MGFDHKDQEIQSWDTADIMAIITGGHADSLGRSQRVRFFGREADISGHRNDCTGCGHQCWTFMLTLVQGIGNGGFLMQYSRPSRDLGHLIRTASQELRPFAITPPSEEEDHTNG